jgi:hypothetical protein
MYVEFHGKLFLSLVLFLPFPEHQQHLCSSEAVPIEEAWWLPLGFLSPWLHDVRGRYLGFTHAKWSCPTGMLFHPRYSQPPNGAITD